MIVLSNFLCDDIEKNIKILVYIVLLENIGFNKI